MPPQFPPHVAEECARFFFSFSRIESALKEHDYWEKNGDGWVAPNWTQFIKDHEAGYAISRAGTALLDLAPQRQIAKDGSLSWEPLVFKADASDMKRVVESLKTVRNNLFHGGKTGRDSEQRTLDLIRVGTAVIDELAQMGLEDEYRGTY